MGEITLQKAIESTLETLEQQYKENNEKLGLSEEEYKAVVRTIKGLDVPVEEFKNASLSISEDINIEDISDEPISDKGVDKEILKELENELKSSPLGVFINNGYRVFEYDNIKGLMVIVDGKPMKPKNLIDKLKMSKLIDKIAIIVVGKESSEDIKVKNDKFELTITDIENIVKAKLTIDVTNLIK